MILVTYDLNKRGQNYQKLTEAIKSLGDWWHYLDSTWLLKTRLTTEQVANRLKQEIDDNDSLLVIEVNPHNSRGWLPEEAWDWIYDRVSR
ncbi:hypothetical protein ACE1B6_24200 [Aerosakkonemataceae cyanobacterium BLCC-F154]|uniref:SinR n=1 Tax=Floridaenema fluviatile BLCC-F154 TaxID=3153640 RepID=A0ABV4YHQ6_9CYAN